MKKYLPNYIDALNKKEISFTDALLELTNKEIIFREDRAARINLAISNFPYEKRITDFDFSYQPNIDKQVIDDLISLRFVSDKENVLFIGQVV